MWILGMWGQSKAGRWAGIIWWSSTIPTEEVSRKLLFSPGHASTMLSAMGIQSGWGVGLCPKNSLIVRVAPKKVMIGWRESRVNRLWVCWAVWWSWESRTHIGGPPCHWPLVNDTSSVCHSWRNRGCHQMASTLWELHLTWKKNSKQSLSGVKRRWAEILKTLKGFLLLTYYI